MRTPIIGLAVAFSLLITPTNAAWAVDSQESVGTTASAHGIKQASATAAPNKDWLVATLASYHKDRETPYNEQNFGLGYENVISNRWSIEGGWYENSFKRTSWYAAATWKPLQLGDFSSGVAFTCVSGYEKKPLRFNCIPVPIITYQINQIAVELIGVPEVIGLRLKVRFR